MKSIQTILSRITLFFTAFILAFTLQGVTAFAADDPFADENAKIKTELTDIVNKLNDSQQEESAKKLQAIIDALDAADDDDDKLQDAESAKDLIISVMEDESVMDAIGAGKNKYQSNLVVIEKQWINNLGDAIASYGFSLNKYDNISVEDNSYLMDTGSGSDAEAAKADKSSKMIQKLRWGQKDGDSRVNIVGLLKRFEEGKFAAISTILQSISAALVVAFGAANLLKLSSDRMASYDGVLREFAKIIFGVWFIFNYRYFTILVLRIGTYFTEIILDGVTFDTEQSQVAATLRYGLWKSLEGLMSDGSADSILHGVASAASNVLGYTGVSEKLSGWDSFQEFIAKGFGGIATVGTLGGNKAVGGTIVNLAINWVVFAILIELAIRYVFTPIAIADLYSEGFHSNGMRWLKKMLSCCLAGGLIYISMYAANIIKTQLIGIHPIQTAAINLTMIGFFAKSRQIADEIVGVR